MTVAALPAPDDNVDPFRGAEARPLTQFREAKGWLFLVRADTDMHKLGSAVYEFLKEIDIDQVTLRTIGAAAVNQAIKGAIEARKKFAVDGKKMIVTPGFKSVKSLDGVEFSAIVLHCSLLM